MTSKLFMLLLLGLLTNSLFAQQKKAGSGYSELYQNKFSIKKRVIRNDVRILKYNGQRDADCKLPIKPTRTISFTTDEGSHMNVDVSPDGRTLVFDLLGDLYTVSITGGKAKQLTRGIALNLRPVWSPDCSKIAYISDNTGDFRLNVIDITRKFHRVFGKSEPEGISYGTNALWTPDGHYIYTSGQTVYCLTGGDEPFPMNIKDPLLFSSKERSIYYINADSLYCYNYTYNTRTAISILPGNAQLLTLSPDARWLAYISDSNSRRRLVVRNVLNAKEQVLISSLFERDSSYFADVMAPHYSFSPDSKTIFIGYAGKIHRITIEDGTNQIIPFSADVKADLGPYNYNTFRLSHDKIKVRYTRSANASPDGKQLVFSALDQLYVMNLPQGKARLLSPQRISQYQPVYSPDGHWIAYISWCDTIGGAVWRVPASGGKPEQLTSIAGQYQRPAWSPDGKYIAIIRGKPMFGDRDDPGWGQLEIIPVNGGDIQVIDDSIPLWNQLAFSQNGDRIIYQPKFRVDKNSRTGPLLVSKNLERTNLQIIATGVNAILPQQLKISPDSRYIVYSADENLYLRPVSKAMVPTPISAQGHILFGINFSPGIDPNWEKGGKILSWSYGNHFFRVDPDKIITQAERKIQKNQYKKISDQDILIAPVTPDQVITMNVTEPSFYARGTIAFKNVRILTMQGLRVIERGTILVKDGRFIAIGPSDQVPIPARARVMDMPGTTVMPGLVDVHLHMRIPPNVFPQQSWMFLINLAYGVTTARDPSVNFDSFGYKELLESGRMIGPRLYTVGRAIRFSDGVVQFNNLNDARAVVYKRAILGGTVIKQYELPTRIEREWLLMACREAGLNMTNEGGQDAILQLGMIKDGSTGVEHNPIWGNIYRDIGQFIAASHTFLTPTLQVCYGSEEGKSFFNYKYWHQADAKLAHFTYSDPKGKSTSNGAESFEAIVNARPKDSLHLGFLVPGKIDSMLYKNGVRLVLGSHGNDEGIGAHNELWALQMSGLSNMEALRAATIAGAEAIGVQKDLGSIKVGKIADLIILNKNPLDDIRNSREIRYVVKDGVVYDGNTLDEIWPEAKKCPQWKIKLEGN